MKRVFAKIAWVLGLAAILFQLNFPQTYVAVAASKSAKDFSTDVSKPGHGRALALVRKDMNMARAAGELEAEGRSLKMSSPTFSHIGAVDGDTTGGDWYAVILKADKSEDEQAFVMATVDVKNQVVAAVSVFRASYATEDKTEARLNMQEIRDNGVETKNKTMIIRKGRAFTEDGKEIRAQAASIWGSTASAAVTTCDVVCGVSMTVVCWAVGTVITGGLGTLIAAVACGLVALYYCDQVCTSWDNMWDAMDPYN